MQLSRSYRIWNICCLNCPKMSCTFANKPCWLCSTSWKCLWKHRHWREFCVQIAVCPVVTRSSSQACTPANHLTYLPAEAKLCCVSKPMFAGQTNRKTVQQDVFLVRFPFHPNRETLGCVLLLCCGSVHPARGFCFDSCYRGGSCRFGGDPRLGPSWPLYWHSPASGTEMLCG